MNDDESSSDPLTRLPYDVHDLIFQHLRSPEIKEISKINSRWYELIGNSIVAMEKMVLHLKISSQVDRKWIQSTRRYVSLVCDFRRASDASVFKEIFLEVAVDLHNLKIRNIDEIQLEDVDLSKLKKFEVSWIASKETLDKALKINSKKLKILRIKAGISDHLDVFLHKQQHLQYLELSGGSQSILCHENLASAANLRLVSLKIGFLHPKIFDDIKTSEENLFNFLDKQESTLQRISIFTSLPSIIQKVVALQNIQYLQVGYTYFGVDRNLQLIRDGKELNGNKNVIKAKICASARDLTKLLCLLPNLQQLRIRELTSGLLKIVTSFAPNLKKLFFNSLNKKIIQDAYDEMKHNDNINQKIQLVPVENKFVDFF